MAYRMESQAPIFFPNNPDDLTEKKVSPEKNIQERDLMQDRITDLIAILEEKNPEKFGPAWIARNTPYRRFFEERLRIQPDLIGWQVFVDLLPLKWNQRWEYTPSHIHLEKDISQISHELENHLENENPETFNKQWLFETNQALYAYITRYAIDRETKKPRWDDIISSLSQKWKSRWRIGIRDEKKKETQVGNEGLAFKEAVHQLNELLAKNNPPSFSPVYVEKNSKKLYRFFCDYIRDSQGNVDWDRIIAELDDKFQEKFSSPTRNREKALEELNMMLETNNPPYFNSKYIETENSSLFRYLCLHFRDINGNVDWKTIVSRLDKKFQERFKKSRAKEARIPQKTYSDRAEVELMMSKNHNKLFAFFGYKGLKDSTEITEICKEFIKLIQKGNIFAKEKFLSFLKFLVNDWLDNVKGLSIYKHRPDVLEEKIETCIRLYKIQDNSKSFTTYLYTALVNNAPRLRGQTKIIELDKPSFADSSEKNEGIFDINKI